MVYKTILLILLSITVNAQIMLNPKRATTLGGGGVAPPDTGTVLLDSLKAYWAMEDSTDSHGSNDLTNDGGVAFVSGLVNNCGDFEKDIVAHFRIAENAEIELSGTTDFTIAFWDSLETVGSQPLFGKYVSYNIQSYTAGVAYPNIRFEVTPDGVAANLVQVNSPVGSGWMFVIMWRDNTTDSIYIQVNNGSIVQASYSDVVFDNNQDFTIGKADGNSATNYDGLMDEFAIWKRVLTVGERTYLYNNGTGRTYTGGKIQ